MYGQPGQPSYIFHCAFVEKPCSVRNEPLDIELPPTVYHVFAKA